MIGLGVILLAAAAGWGVARWTRLPVIPLLLVGGLLLSLVVPDLPFTRNAVELGLTFLVFTAGIELNPKRFGKHLRAVLWVGLVQFVVVGLVGFGVARALGFTATASLYLGMALSTSSTLVVVNQLKLQHQMFEPFGRVVIGVLLIQDLLMIFLIVVMARFPEGFPALSRGLAWLLVLGGAALICQRWLIPYLVARLGLDDESLLLAILALLFLFLGVAHFLRLPPVAGAFLAGFSLSRFPVNGVVRGLLNSISDFFQAVFFTALGGLILGPEMLTGIGQSLGPALLVLIGQGLILSLVVLLLTPPLVTLLAEWAGLTSRPALESGLLLAQTSEFALILGLTGSEVLGQIEPATLSLIALVTVATMTWTPFLATDRVTTYLLRFHPLRRRAQEPGRHQNHVLVLGFGAGGMWVIKPLRESGHEVLVVDDDPGVIEQLQKSRIHCIRGDGSDPKVLARAGAREAKLILASMPRASESERVLRHAPKVPVVVRVFEEAEAEAVRNRGGIPILNSAAAADAFLEWFKKTHASGTPEDKSLPS
jgi:K+:H+ antiporter